MKGYSIIGGLTAGGAMGHYLFWSAFPDGETAWAALLMWVILGAGHLIIYAIQANCTRTLAAAVAIPALIRLFLLPALLVALVKLLAPDIRVLGILFVGELFLFMGLELALVYRNAPPRSSL